jgi:hypothetical protein
MIVREEMELREYCPDHGKLCEDVGKVKANVESLCKDISEMKAGINKLNCRLDKSWITMSIGKVMVWILTVIGAVALTEIVRSFLWIGGRP